MSCEQGGRPAPSLEGGAVRHPHIPETETPSLSPRETRQIRRLQPPSVLPRVDSALMGGFSGPRGLAGALWLKGPRGQASCRGEGRDRIPTEEQRGGRGRGGLWGPAGSVHTWVKCLRAPRLRARTAAGVPALGRAHLVGRRTRWTTGNLVDLGSSPGSGCNPATRLC